MLRLNRALWLSAAAALFAFGCGDGGGSDGGTSCTSDATCGSGKVCHPILKECIASCTGSSDCPSTAKTCAKFDGTAGSASAPGFCQCSTDQLCNGGSTGSLVCSTATKRCENKCTSNSGCPSGYTCNTTTGQCSGGGGGDAGMDGGATTCNSANSQPDVCGYGKVCNSANTCDPVVDGTCVNVTQAIAKSNHTAWTSASTGPIIFNAIDEAHDLSADCAMGNAFTTTVYAYAPTGSTFPAMKSALPGFFYLDSSGNKTDIPTNLLKQSNYAQIDSGKMMSAKFTFCPTSVTSNLGVAVAFTNGNGFCFTLATPNQP